MKKKNKQDQKKDSKETLNYNDRKDGYGFGEADGEAKHEEDEKGKDEDEAKKYGEVDQYSFRVPHIGGQHESEEETERRINRDP